MKRNNLSKNVKNWTGKFLVYRYVNYYKIDKYILLRAEEKKTQQTKLFTEHTLIEQNVHRTYLRCTSYQCCAECGGITWSHSGFNFPATN